jgi:hypothetical protein
MANLLIMYIRTDLLSWSLLVEVRLLVATVFQRAEASTECSLVVSYTLAYNAMQCNRMLWFYTCVTMGEVRWFWRLKIGQFIYDLVLWSVVMSTEHIFSWPFQMMLFNLRLQVNEALEPPAFTIACPLQLTQNWSLIHFLLCNTMLVSFGSGDSGGCWLYFAPMNEFLAVVGLSPLNPYPSVHCEYLALYCWNFAAVSHA